MLRDLLAEFAARGPEGGVKWHLLLLRRIPNAI